MSDPNTAAFHKAARALNEAGDRQLKLAFGRGLRAAAKPLGDQMVQGLAAKMPRRGGLSARVAGSKVSIRASTAGSNPRVTLSLADAQKDQLGGMDAGTVRHPVYGRRAWVAQRVPSGGAREAFDRGAPVVREQVVRELNAALRNAARKGSS